MSLLKPVTIAGVSSVFQLWLIVSTRISVEQFVSLSDLWELFMLCKNLWKTIKYLLNMRLCVVYFCFQCLHCMLRYKLTKHEKTLKTHLTKPYVLLTCWFVIDLYMQSVICTHDKLIPLITWSISIQHFPIYMPILNSSGIKWYILSAIN